MNIKDKRGQVFETVTDNLVLVIVLLIVLISIFYFYREKLFSLGNIIKDFFRFG